MNLNHLRIFQAAAERGGISSAAERLGLSQSAVSRQISEFEQTLGLRLFDRLPRGVRLTEAGRRLQAHANQLVNTERQAESAVRDLKLGVSGRVRIGASRTVGAYLLPESLAGFASSHPRVEISLEVESTANIEARLMAAEIDIGFVEGVAEAEAVEYHPFASDELLLIAAPGHPLAGQDAVAPSSISRHRLLMHEPGSGTRAVTERAFAAKGISLRPAMTMASTEAIKHTVATGIGIAVLSGSAIRHELAAGVLCAIPMRGLRIRRSLYRLQLKGAWRSPALEAFIDKLV